MRRARVMTLAIGFLGIGANGCSSDDAADGKSAAASVFDVSVLAAGTECPSGGQRVSLGTDRNANGKLDDGEITKKYVVCNGQAGAPTLLQTSVEAAGAECPSGGTRVAAGVDADRDGKLSANEIVSSDVVCSGGQGTPG